MVKRERQQAALGVFVCGQLSQRGGALRASRACRFSRRQKGSCAVRRAALDGPETRSELERSIAWPVEECRRVEWRAGSAGEVGRIPRSRVNKGRRY